MGFGVSSSLGVASVSAGGSGFASVSAGAGRGSGGEPVSLARSAPAGSPSEPLVTSLRAKPRAAAAITATATSAARIPVRLPRSLASSRRSPQLRHTS